MEDVTVEIFTGEVGLVIGNGRYRCPNHITTRVGHLEVQPNDYEGGSLCKSDPYVHYLGGRQGVRFVFPGISIDSEAIRVAALGHNIPGDNCFFWLANVLAKGEPEIQGANDVHDAISLVKFCSKLAKEVNWVISVTPNQEFSNNPSKCIIF